LLVASNSTLFYVKSIENVGQRRETVWYNGFDIIRINNEIIMCRGVICKEFNFGLNYYLSTSKPFHVNAKM
jgi:hypothetical protein